MNENEKHLLKIKDEMENVRELYIKGYIEKKMYQKETVNTGSNAFKQTIHKEQEKIIITIMWNHTADFFCKEDFFCTRNP